ncbi:MAG: SGNH/GDSL hydrolase family protein [Roseburia sp.]|nr:SGNH/GDSL hydrolase family protein [Roseburia sp.]
MAGPKAPKDPKAKGSSFYICRQKEVAGNPVPGGKGIQYIYLDDVRLVTFARMVGNVTDEEMLKQLKTAEGFLNMVAGIGVAVEAQERDDNIDFAFQMYGKTDPNHSGNTITISCRPDGMEQIIWLDDYEWSEDNNVPGQMRFEFCQPGRMAVVDVRLYLREGYTAPEQEECHPIDRNSSDYQRILERSLMSAGNYARLKKVIDKAKRGEEVTISFIGGSITQGAGAIPIHLKSYAYQTWERFKEAFGSRVKLIKAGVGGTPSELGMVRYDRDVLREGSVVPDLVVIEFAVNDEGDETKGLCYESLIRKALSTSEETAVVLLFAVFADDYNLEERLVPVGERYELPMVSIRRAVVEQFYQKPGEGRVLSKSQFFYDSYHPANIGHTIMADCLMYLFRRVEESKEMEEVDWRSKEPLLGAAFTDIRLADKHSNTDKLKGLKQGSFSEKDEELQRVEMDDRLMPVPQFPYNWQHVSGEEPFSFKICCKALVIVSKDSGEVESGRARVLVDGKEVLTLNPREIGWIHCNAQILFNEQESKEHEIVVSMLPEDVDKKLTILGFGYVE